MSEVRVNKIQPEEESVLLVTQQVDALYDEIRRRAFRLFESRQGTHGHDKEDWLEAERSLVFAPPAELAEGDDQFVIRMAVAGFEPHQIRVTVLPGTIIVDGDLTTTSEQRDHKVCFSEFTDRKLVRRLDLPQEVETHTAKATLENGLLQITARKAVRGSIEESAMASAAGA